MRKTIACIVLFLLPVTAITAQQTITHPWFGKRVAYFGDSVTDPRNNASRKKYWSFLQEWLDITPYVYAVSGRQWNDIPRQANALKEEHGDDFDAIVILMGTNDYNQAVPLGSWYEQTMGETIYGHGYNKRNEKRMRRQPAFDNNTYRGRINIAIDTLKRMFPTKQIVLLTPLHRGGFYANETNWQCSEDYVNRCGEYLDAYAEDIVQAGKIWALPVIDLGSLSGLFPLLDVHSEYFNNAETDRLHPNDSGHERMARTLMYQLLTLPCTF